MLSLTRELQMKPLITNINLKNYTIQTLSADFLKEWDCFCWGSLIKGYELSGNELIYLKETRNSSKTEPLDFNSKRIAQLRK